MRLLLWFLALLVAASTPAVAQQPPLGPNEARGDGWGVLMLTTDDAEAFLRAWAEPTPPRLETTTIAVRGRPFFAMILFHGCRAGADGNCHLTGEIAYLRPDGSAYGEPLRGDVWRGPPAPNDNIQLSPFGPTLIVESDDPMGAWTIRVRIADNIRGTTLQVEQQVTVETPPAPAPAST